MNSQNRIKFSVVVPLYNEERNVTPLYARLTRVMTGLEEPYEIIFVDDGSKDATRQVLSKIYESDPCVRIVILRRNFGQTAALKAGFDAARGEIVISMDGDLQHDPEEIPAFIAKLEEGYDIVSGWRAQRMDTWLTRKLPSRIANWAMAKLSGVPLHISVPPSRLTGGRRFRVSSSTASCTGSFRLWRLGTGRGSQRSRLTILGARTGSRTMACRELSASSWTY
jgi:glycosyltransferase involved in cell wall biosynthesis